MAKSKNSVADIKVRLPADLKALFETAADKSHRSLNQWLIHAGEEQAKQEGVTTMEPKKRSGR